MARPKTTARDAPETGAETTAQPAAAAVAAVAATDAAAEQLRREAMPVVRVNASRDRWRAKRFWPKGDTDLTLPEAETLGQEGFELLRRDPVFTIVPLAEADKQGESA
ncbi:MAG: hypothetical protein NTV97_03510 [Alphaproteobacteria bacterium]|nr:hypothetical protein [Alphaproteobacteria bacterium]